METLELARQHHHCLSELDAEPPRDYGQKRSLSRPRMRSALFHDDLIAALLLALPTNNVHVDMGL